MHQVFVYGTLKRGFPLHDRGLQAGTYLGPCHTRLRYPMLLAGPMIGPMMFDEPGVGLQIQGELYEVDDATLALMDRLECVGQPGNYRGMIEIVWEGQTRPVIAYFKSRSIAVPQHSGYLDDYQDHHFIPPEARD